MSNRYEIYTPKHVVNKMLNLIGYSGNKIINKKIIDNSCGEGAFLVEILKRLIIEIKKNNFAIGEIKYILENNIYGIDINNDLVKKTINNLNNILIKNNIQINDISWNIHCKDSLKVLDFNEKMDFVVGNPPYINIHNLKHIDYKSFSFTKKGMVDLYLIFFELGLKMLNKTGKLIYITPNSFLTSKAGEIFRNKIISNKLLTHYIDNEHDHIFPNVQTYTGITLLEKNNIKERCFYSKLTNNIKIKLNYFDFYINDKFYFKVKEFDENLKNILNFKLNKKIVIRNGIATNANDIFFGFKENSFYSKKLFKINNLNSKELKYSNSVFPYDSNLKIYDIEEIKKNDIDLFNYFLKNKTILKSRALKKEQKWWEFSRIQGFTALQNEKLVINNILRTEEQVILRKIDKDILVYGSGYYIYSLSEKYNLNWIANLMENKRKQFIEYITLIGKNKGSSYYFFSTNDLNRFISYQIEKDKLISKNINKKIETHISGGKHCE